MRQQVISPDHSEGIHGKKASSKAFKGDDFSETGRRLTTGDVSSLDEDKPAPKMPGGRLKGSSAYQSKEHKGSKEHKDHKERKDEKDGKDHNDVGKAEENAEAKASESHEVNYEEAEGQSRRVPDGEQTLQWPQRKRPRHREPPGLLKASIRADRRVVRADKQVAVQPASQSRGNVLRPSNGSAVEATSGTAKRNGDKSGSGPTLNDNDNCQPSGGHQVQGSGDAEEQRHQHSATTHTAEKVPAANSGGHNAAAPCSARRADGHSLPEKIHATEKLSLDFFEWPKIVTSLTRKEKEDDFTAIKGTKLPQRPKRRPKTVEKNVQFISPGTWLCDLTRERYEVREKKAVKKKPRGLKAMGSVDSDSD